MQYSSTFHKKIFQFFQNIFFRYAEGIGKGEYMRWAVL